ncbi:hypothetical protein ZIOFF_005966 [Zingiber officinale]|uniref:Retrotransposon gag domain-containing protein n=1 Tax=Zingiber officinale TaxID=94328 RepID=A0A8J5HN58_ZINOF|nr:hypothetical protein ZIOFF_005966 [Zingiber officinale]
MAFRKQKTSQRKSATLFFFSGVYSPSHIIEQCCGLLAGDIPKVGRTLASQCVQFREKQAPSQLLDFGQAPGCLALDRYGFQKNTGMPYQPGTMVSQSLIKRHKESMSQRWRGRILERIVLKQDTRPSDPYMPLRCQNTPPPLNASEQVLAGLVHLLHQNADTSQAARSEMPYEKFCQMGPPEFIGFTDPFVSEGWVRSLETIFRYMRLEDTTKVSCVVFQLKEDAALWWEGAERVVNMETLTWEEFKKISYDKYFTLDVQARLKREFRNLQQGDMSVVEYVKKFDRGCHFSPLIADNPAEKLQHFLDGLSPVIRRDVLMSDPADYVATLKRAFRASAAGDSKSWVRVVGQVMSNCRSGD